MALPMLVNGADCGPVNPLQGLAKRLDQDRGIQQDYFGAGRAGPSREVFRTQQSPSSAADQQDAARFFSTSPSHAHAPSSQFTAFDMSALQTTLPGAGPSMQSSIPRHAPAPAAASWAVDFMNVQSSAPSSSVLSPKSEGMHAQGEVTHEAPAMVNGIHGGSTQWSPMNGYMMSPMPSFAPQMPLHAQQLQNNIHTDASLWDKEFQAQENLLSSAAPVTQPATEQMTNEPRPEEQDQLARTASMLIDTLREEQSPKFKNSQFMGLMKQLSDRTVVVEGNQMVERSATDWANDFQGDVKGKGKAREVPTSLGHQGGMPWYAVPMPTEMSRSSLETMNQQEDPNEAYFRQDNEEYAQYWNAHHSRPHAVNRPSAQMAEWDHLQRDWDSFEATATGIRPMANYPFQAHNPYLLGETSSRTRHHMMHADRPQAFFESVLELEAAVQLDPTDARAWYDLGVKQQENEREDKAIQALLRAVELDPSHLPSWLALAISQTNEGNRWRAFGAINEWVNRNEKYSDAVERYRAVNPDREDALQADRFENLIGCLISMARSDVSGQIDADIQVALAVLLNTNEDFDKAHDCFTTALAVRPDDWLLYNRAGATLANNGRAEEALQYYYRALELNPAYIRARFNLGISCINLRRHDEAAQHILDALVLQDGDSVRGAPADDARGITSSALWDSLKTTCLNLQRSDLAALCDRQDLEGFRSQFLA